jgi:hypothetical protein
VHQVAEEGVILHDPLAVPILGETRAALLAHADGGDRRMRWFVCARARYAEGAGVGRCPSRAGGRVG